MARTYRFVCTNCGRQPGLTRAEARTKLYTKRVEFRRYGFKGGLIRSRTVAWLCRPCLFADTDYNRPTNEVSDEMVQ